MSYGEGEGYFRRSNDEGYAHYPHHQHGHVDPPPRRETMEVTGEILKIFCEARPDFNLAVRHHEVVLVPGDDNDPNQTWIKDESWSTKVKDSAGFPAFALVNRGTGKALLHHIEAPDSPVMVEDYEMNVLNEAVLWTASKDVGNGYRAIRPVSNIHLNLDADHGSEKYGGVKDGNKVILFKWKDEPNQHWHMAPVELQRDHHYRPQEYEYERRPVDHHSRSHEREYEQRHDHHSHSREREREYEREHHGQSHHSHSHPGYY
ncbi:hypothetical protein MPTK1_8g12700 [Marchantia polymorpha subsp. ruderalis]|uniref:Uncharacterized protein n=1 Tax=Marchantia polymorpha TaxID=3197 RepID=A0A2R6WJP0_MARPO|nr:hypothetical protein MARPO_0083s0050 [Marchantia polymorpha]BBN19681.1 hypothetical protein Mp_8g12700 [Marchantia polymorpha subsp. ruderalis]|eukprot:PTQ34085.1 hypothetical protein MARPO_0083s0050 [Marchantia polymorpha]